MRDADVTISSLGEYIEVIEKYNLQKQYFRGENQEYSSISSSIIREYVPTRGSYGLVDIYSNLLSAYYQEVGYELDAMQSENFLAFSQHHGLKTNFIDFTTAPLVALYFACDRKNYDVTNGYVYLLSEEETVDASEFLRNYSIKGNSCYNVFSRLANNDEGIITEFRHLLEKYTGLLSNKNPFDLVFNMAKLISMYPNFEKSNSYLSSRGLLGEKGVDGICEIPQLVKQYIPDFDIRGGMGIMEFTALLLMFFDDLSTTYYPDGLPCDIVFPKIPYLMYKTPLKFDRIRNQNGIFLYQAFLDYQTNLDEMGGLMIQKIIPSFIIKVNNQKKIMDELDLVGINRKFIYGDFDSTAQYINAKLFNEHLNLAK